MSIDTVKQYFAKWQMEDRVLEFAVSSATVAAAASAVGCQEQEIAKTMSFKLHDEVILIVLAGDARINNAKFKAQFKTKAVLLKGDEVEVRTGHPVGGVCPFALPDDVTVYLDESLKRFEIVYPACGTANSAIGLTIPELEKTSRRAGWVDVGKIDA